MIIQRRENAREVESDGLKRLIAVDFVVVVVSGGGGGGGGGLL